jgi:hypothetical protein
MQPHSTALAKTVNANDWYALSAADRRLLTPAVIEKWTRGLAPDEIDLVEVVRLERSRTDTLRTLRQGVELTDREWQLVRYLSRSAGQVRTYLQIARHLWQTPANPISPRSLMSLDAGRRYNGAMITTIHVLVSQIRRKLEIDPLRPQHLANVRGVGYVWYNAPPSLDDGIDYGRRATEHAMLREEIQREWGIYEGEVLVVMDRDGRPFETRVLPGPEHPDRPALSGD